MTRNVVQIEDKYNEVFFCRLMKYGQMYTLWNKKMRRGFKMIVNKNLVDATLNVSLEGRLDTTSAP